MDGDKELFAMMDGCSRPDAAPQAAERQRRKNRLADRTVGSAATTMLFLAATVLGYIHPHLGALVTAVCFIRLLCRIWRWRRG